MCVVAGIPGAVVKHLEVITLLAVRFARLCGVGINECAAVKWREQPFVRVHNEAVCALNAVEKRPGRRRRQSRPPVCAVHVEPQLLFGAGFADTLHVVDDAQIGGAGGARHRKQPRSVFRAELGNGCFHVIPRELVPTGLDQIGIHHLRRLCH